jgi:putative ABC transport system permease protein
MRFLEIIRMAFDSLLRHKTRAILTMLGIIIGVGAVVAMVAVGNGARTSVESQIASLGTNVLMIFPGSFSQRGVSGGAASGQGLTEDDINAIRESAPAVGAITPMARASRQVIAGNLNWYTSIQGGNTDFFSIRDWKLKSGELFTEQDVRGSTKVCVIGQTVVDNLFPNQDPVGQMIRIQKLPFEIIGTLVAKGQTGMGQDQDDIIIAPFSTVQYKIMGEDHIHSVILSAVDKTKIAAAQSQVTEILRARHRIQDSQDNDFTIRNQSDITAAATSTTDTFTYLLASIASVSLLVGGIGIMNIMLVSVTERTREIGISMSIGARRRDILLQFLTEASTLTIIGGLIGIGLGVLSSSLISRFAGWPVFISYSAILVAFLFSAAVGIFFGYYPAYKASRLRPVDALRWE